MVNYLAEANSGNDTLTVALGDTFYLRLKTWNEGEGSAENIDYSGTFTNPQYLTNQLFSLDGSGAGDLGTDGHGYSIAGDGYDSGSGIASFSLDFSEAGSTVDTNTQGGLITSTVSSDTPDGTVILVTVAITQANPFGVAWLDRLTNRAYADDSATTQARILVQSPPVDRTAAPTLTPTATATTAATTTATSTATGNSILPITGISSTQ